MKRNLIIFLIGQFLISLFSFAVMYSVYLFKDNLKNIETRIILTIASFIIVIFYYNLGRILANNSKKRNNTKVLLVYLFLGILSIIISIIFVKLGNYNEILSVEKKLLFYIIYIQPIYLILLNLGITKFNFLLILGLAIPCVIIRAGMIKQINFNKKRYIREKRGLRYGQ